MTKHKEIIPLLRCEHEEHPEQYLRVTRIVEKGKLVLECPKCYTLLSQGDLPDPVSLDGGGETDDHNTTERRVA